MSKNKNKNKKKKFVGGHRVANPMAEILRINKMLNNINIDDSVSGAIKKVNSLNNKIIDNNSVQVASQLLENTTVIKKFNNSDFSIKTYVEKEEVQVVNKPFVIGYLKDYTACGHFRMIYPMNLINSRFSFTGKINCTLFPRMIVQDDIILHVRAIVFQRPTGEEATYSINAYKQFQAQYQYKLIGELDDYVFEVPMHHPLFLKNTVEHTRSLLLNLAKLDEIIVSTENLKKALIELGLTNRITVIENYLPKHLYQTDVKRFRFEDIKKPVIAYTGADSHYNNSLDLDGDFSGNTREFIEKNIDNYEFIFFGNVPNFLKKHADEGKIVIVPSTNPLEYPINLKKYRADFVIAPLEENIFNSCKSDLRYLEAAAAGAVFIGSRFEGEMTSPYQFFENTFTSESTVEDIENIINSHLNVDSFNNSLSDQYNFLDTRWLENNQNLMKFVEAYSSGISGVSVEESHPQYESVKEFLK